MLYQKERDLQLDLTTKDFGLGNQYKVAFIRREVPVGGCVPDLVIVFIKEYPDGTIWPKRWNYRHAYVIWLLRQKKYLLPEELAALCYEPLERIRPFIQDLITSRCIVRSELSGVLSLSEQVASIQAEVIAVEAKLYKWREALTQAERYLEFADKVFVAMDADRSPRNPKALDAFSKTKIGLCAITPESINWLVKPESDNKSKTHEREYLVTSAVVPSRQTLWERRND